MRAHSVLGCLCSAILVVLLGVGLASEEDRDRLLQPESVMDAVGVRRGMVIGEVGAGEGYFTVKLARAVGPRGRIWANDIDEDALEELGQRCRREGIHNVATVVGRGVEPNLPARALEQVWFVYSLHDIDDPVALLRNLRPSLAPGATVIVLDQDPERTGSGHFLAADRVREIFSEAGYRVGEAPGVDLERDFVLRFF